jgi:diguanylate cyclase (GGDEF)-like protein
VSLLPTSIVYEEIRPILWTTIGVAAGFIVIALAAGLFLAHDFVGNIERLNRYMEAVESGDYRVRYCVSGSDEFAQLNARLNTMVHHLAESIQSLQVESNTDALCEIYNRRYLMDRLAEYLGTLESTGPHDRCTAGHRTLSVALFDADHFKSVNDAHGHTTGDDVLRRISRILSHSFPPPATAGRFGGEEFMVLLPGISYQAACERAEEFRSMLEAQAWREHDLVITISGGVAEARVTDDPESLIHRADQALYRAKRNGRNRIACWANC